MTQVFAEFRHGEGGHVFHESPHDRAHESHSINLPRMLREIAAGEN